MDYEEEFYEVIKRERREIKSLDIPEAVKSRLYLLIDESIEKFDETKTREKIFQNLNKIWEGVYSSLEKINSMFKSNSSILEKISKSQKLDKKLREVVEKQLEKRNILPFSNYIPFSLS